MRKGREGKRREEKACSAERERPRGWKGVELRRSTLKSRSREGKRRGENISSLHVKVKVE